MAKNDYRRQLIMLRGLEKGYGGHARLEKRVLTGSMDFMTSADASDVLEASFVGVRGGKTRVQPLGLFKEGPRGQKALLANFDPRNIAGMDLSEVQAAVISRVDNGQRTPVMYGCINGVCTLNWAQITRALNESGTTSDRQGEQNAPDTSNLSNNTIEDLSNHTTEARPSALDTASPVTEAEEVLPDIPDMQNPSAPKAQTPSTNKSAASLLNLDMSLPWPEDIESLRLLFMTLPAYEPFEMDGYVFIRAKMAEETGVDHCAVGIRAEDGKVTGVCYAIPMPYSSEPPAGLEEYMWMGDTASGWWVTCDDIDPY